MDGFIGKHAIVLGGGFAGLLTSHVLAKYFEKVTVIEEDPKPIAEAGGFSPRPGVPQGWHGHNITLEGVKILDELFPKFEEMLVANGSYKVDITNDTRTRLNGCWEPRFKSDKFVYSQTRPLLEETIRSLVEKYNNIHFLYEKKICAFLDDPQKKCLTGVRIITKDTDEESTTYADLVVDAMGRNSIGPEWLKNLGYKFPDKEIIKDNVRYATQIFHLPEEISIDWLGLSESLIPYPYKKKKGSIWRVEDNSKGNRYIVTLSEQHEESSIKTNEDFIQFARLTQLPELYEFVEKAIPLSSIFYFKYPQARFYYYDKISAELPDRFIAIGDALCSVNPVLAQGMTLASSSVVLLNKVLMTSNKDNYIANLKFKYFKQMRKVINPPWKTASLHDFLFKETEGKIPWDFGLANWYSRLIARYGLYDHKLLVNLYEVGQLRKSSLTLFSPSVLLRIIWQKIKGK